MLQRNLTQLGFVLFFCEWVMQQTDVFKMYQMKKVISFNYPYYLA